MSLTSESDALPAARRTVATWTWRVLQTLVTLQTLDALLQPVFAGRFLSGDFGMLGVHRDNATYVGVLSIAVTVAALVAWRVCRVPGRIVLALSLVGPVAAVEIFLGYARTLGIHVPLGAAVVALSGWLAVWVWTRGPDTAEGGRR
jgi:hypothetical protein